MTKIKCAAIYHLGVVVTGKHHGECMRKLPKDRIKSYDVQGFLTSNGDFVDRVEGFGIAYAAGQLKNGYSKFGYLYSEDYREVGPSGDC